jgi:hypothetical protein
MLPDEMEAEKNRKIIVAQAEEIEILKRNVRELQEQLNVAYKKLKDNPYARTEYGGPKGAEPTRYGTWESEGREIDF